MSRLKRLLGYLNNYRKETALSVSFNFLSSLFALISVPTLIPFLQIIFEKNPQILIKPKFSLTEKYFINVFYYYMNQIISDGTQLTALLYLIYFIVIVFICKNIFRYLGNFYMAPVRNGVVHDLQNKLYGKILDADLSYFSKERKGDLISKVTSDVKEVEYGVLGFLDIAFKDPINMVLNLSLLFMISFKLTLFILLMMGLISIIIGVIGKTLKRQSLQGQSKLGKLISLLEETITGIRIIKGFNNQKFMMQKFSILNKEYFKTMNSIIRRRDLSSPLTEVLIIIVICIVLWFGGHMVLTKQISSEVFIGFMVIFFLLIEPAKRISNAWYNVQKGLASFDRIEQILLTQSTVTEIHQPTPIKEFTSTIEFNNVVFAYNNYDNKQVIKGINLKIEKGKMIALVGLSGSGKTTLADLLCRFYDVTGGKITIDGVDLKDLNLKDFRNLLGIVSQDAILFNDTIYSNICFGMDFNIDKVIEAAKVANCHEFISALPDQYNTVIGDRGQNLSGGERQRLTIARAVLRNPSILVLDEATSSLDSESEKLVQDALFKLMKNRTSIVIAHRLSTIQYSDEIIVLQEGEIVERGNHIGLLAKQGLYSKLVALQAF